MTGPDAAVVDADAVRAVRPYTVTGGRTRTGRPHLPIEALVRAIGPARHRSGMAVERQRILDLTGPQVLSVAELAVHLKLPWGVVRVLLADLVDQGAVVVHGATSAAPATDPDVLESVRHGIAVL